MGFQEWKDKHGIGFSGSKAKRERLKIKQQEQGSRDVKNRRGRTTGKEYWNSSTKKWQSTPIKRGRNLPGGSHHKGGEIGAKSNKPSEGKFRTLEVKNKDLAPNTKAPNAGDDRSSAKASAPKDDLASLKKKLKRHASGRNSVAKTKLQLKIRKLEGKK